VTLVPKSLHPTSPPRRPTKTWLPSRTSVSTHSAPQASGSSREMTQGDDTLHISPNEDKGAHNLNFGVEHASQPEKPEVSVEL
jgi:hypothetical protein